METTETGGDIRFYINVNGRMTLLGRGGGDSSVVVQPHEEIPRAAETPSSGGG